MDAAPPAVSTASVRDPRPASDLAASSSSVDECYRCGYALNGILDDQPCPECGLLAVRSRRLTNEFHDSRPGWLRRLSIGTWLLLLAIVTAVGWHPLLAVLLDYRSSFWQGTTGYRVYRHLPWVGADLAVLLLVAGVWLLTAAERYPPADRADRKLRAALRVAAFLPLAALLLRHLDSELLAFDTWAPASYSTPTFGPAAFLLAAAGGVALPLLLAFRMRGLAKRARSAHLAEHCLIVGVGVTCAVLYLGACSYVFEHAREFGLGSHWVNKGTGSLVLLTIFATLSLLFVLWSLYLLVRFAIAFGVAAYRLRARWRRADRSVLSAG